MFGQWTGSFVSKDSEYVCKWGSRVTKRESRGNRRLLFGHKTKNEIELKSVSMGKFTFDSVRLKTWFFDG